MKQATLLWRAVWMTVLAMGCSAVAWAIAEAEFGGLHALVQKADVIAIIRIEYPAALEHGKWVRQTARDLKGRTYFVEKPDLINCSADYTFTPVRVIKGSNITTQTFQNMAIDLVLMPPRGYLAAEDPNMKSKLTPFDLRFAKYQKQVNPWGVYPTSGTLALVFGNYESLSNFDVDHRFGASEFFSDAMPGSVVFLSPKLADVKISGANDEEKVKGLIEKAIWLGNPFAGRK